jgi:diaminopimelate decarboxylase
MTGTPRLRYSEHVWVDEADHLRVEDVDTVDLARRFGTPLFVVSEAQIRANVARYQAAFRRGYPDTEIFFSTKANFNPAVRRVFTLAGAGGDAFGLGELTINLTAGTPPVMIVLNGSNKADPEIRLAVEQGVAIHVDHPEELETIARIAEELGRVARVAPRTRLMLHELDSMEADLPAGAKVGPGARVGNKFGMHWEDTLAVCRRAVDDPRLRLVGLHHHVGRWNHDPAVFSAVVREQVGWVARLRDELDGWTPEYLDFGGGFATPRAEGLGPFGNDRDAPPIETYADLITGTLTEELDRHGLPRPRLIVEPGRAIASNIAVLLGSVGVVKRFGDERTWVSLDVSQNLVVNTLTMAYHYHAVVADRVTAEPAPPVDLVGPLCSFDFLGQGRSLPAVARGDVVALLDTGAYCESKSLQFNALPRPATVLVSRSAVDVISERETVADVIGRMRVPERLRD